MLLGISRANVRLQRIGRPECRASYRYKTQLESKRFVLEALRTCDDLVLIEAGRKRRNGSSTDIGRRECGFGGRA